MAVPHGPIRPIYSRRPKFYGGPMFWFTRDLVLAAGVFLLLGLLLGACAAPLFA